MFGRKQTKQEKREAFDTAESMYGDIFFESFGDSFGYWLW